ncbi:MAG: hypothetical protein P1U85_17690 [Verrucomicrobiales bacterium]|nr:hypothetical protein [Verrucomicrobiales bacterium]
MPHEDLVYQIRKDLYRYTGRLGFSAFCRAWRYEAGFRHTVFMRLTGHFHSHRATRFGVYHLFAFFYHRMCIRYGVHIPFSANIGGGLYLPHALNIVVNKACRLGEDCNLSQGVTLGIANRGERAGTPTIGDRVYIGPGAVVFGAITVENDSAIGANCVVTKDVPESAVVVGVPGKVISREGSTGYINQILPSRAEAHYSSSSDPSISP